MASTTDAVAISTGSSIENRVMRKVRIRILPFVFLLYVIAYLDRINIGFAALTMNRDLGITSQQFGFLAGIFFVGYFLLEVPSNLLLHKIGARVWIARILVSWGLVAALTGLVRSANQLYVLRFVLGLAEAGYVPGILLYLTYWFRRKEQARAIALFLMGLPIASLLGSPLSGLILDQVHWFGVSSWRWLLILEGIPAIVFGILTYLVLPSYPEEAKFLDVGEKQWIQSELARERKQLLEEHQYSAFQTLANGRVWLLIVVYFGMMIGSYTFTIWTPQLVKAVQGDHSNGAIGMLVMIPSIVGLVAMILASQSSDRTLERRYHVAVLAAAGGIALVLLSANVSPLFAEVLLCLLAVSVYGFVGPFWALPGEFLTGSSAAAGIALINSVGCLGGFVGPYVIGYIGGRTGSLHSGMALVGLPMLVSAGFVLILPKGTRGQIRS
jgi:MFS transporter, ACS family, tartrate transporter